MSYNVLYNDGNYLTFDFTEEDYNAICAGLTKSPSRKYALVTSVGLVVLANIRAVVPIREPEEAPKAVNPPMSLDHIAWLKEQEEIEERERNLLNERD